MLQISNCELQISGQYVGQFRTFDIGVVHDRNYFQALKIGFDPCLVIQESDQKKRSGIFRLMKVFPKCPCVLQNRT